MEPLKVIADPFERSDRNERGEAPEVRWVQRWACFNPCPHRDRPPTRHPTERGSRPITASSAADRGRVRPVRSASRHRSTRPSEIEALGRLSATGAE
jgi:hypothetical protein